VEQVAEKLIEFAAKQNVTMSATAATKTGSGGTRAVAGQRPSTGNDVTRASHRDVAESPRAPPLAQSCQAASTQAASTLQEAPTSGGNDASGESRTAEHPSY